MNDKVNFDIFQNSESSSKAEGKDAAGYPSGELDDTHEAAFVEPLPGIKPSESVKARDISYDELRKKNLSGVKDWKTTKGTVDLQASASTGQTAFESTKKTEPVKGKMPGESPSNFFFCLLYCGILSCFTYT